MRRIDHGKEIKPLFRADRLCAGCRGQCGGRGKPLAVPVFGGQGRRRTVSAGVSGAGAHLRLYAADLGYRHWPENPEKRHRSLYGDAPQVEVSRHSYLSGAGADYDLLRGHRRLDHQIRRGLSHRAGPGCRPGRLFYFVYHLTYLSGNFRSAVYGRNGFHRL